MALLERGNLVGDGESTTRRGQPPTSSLNAVQGRLIRSILRRDGSVATTDVGEVKDDDPAVDLEARADWLWLRRQSRPAYGSAEPDVRLADLFSGCGLLSTGALEGACALGLGAAVELAVDIDPSALKVMRASLGLDEQTVRELDLSAVLDGDLEDDPTPTEEAFIDGLGELDIALAGPPCQGHSSLNNHTRHDDERNDLYLRVVRFAELTRPRFCLIENVQAAPRDQRGSIDRARRHLRRLGYFVDDQTLKLNDLGVPQTRRRHVLLACSAGEPKLTVESVVSRHAVRHPESRTVSWAIRDLVGSETGTPFDTPAQATDENVRRMKLLHRYGWRNLPDKYRPDCHAKPKTRPDGEARQHSYKSMYGRLSWDEPAQTVTSGYGSMGQGRYVHPDQTRTLTPHEAARLQLFPDFYDFSSVSSRTQWARMIGNAAPMKLSYVFCLEMLR
jgi:DNA (cytosine-5)-methyltransferase 1